MRVAFLGFGLIGGSIARALHLEAEGEAWHLVAWSPSGRGPERALSDGVIDAVAADPMTAVADADLVVLAGPASACLELLDGLAGPWSGALGPGTVITDVASSKGALVERASAHGLRFVGGHPMAGREAAGYAAATADLFAGRPWVLVPGRAASDAELTVVASLARACGARPLVMTAEDHDAAVAGISHLPLVVAVALVEAVAGLGDGPARADWPEAAPAGRRRVAGHDPGRARRPADGRGDPRHERTGDRGTPARPAGRARRLARRPRGGRGSG